MDHSLDKFDFQATVRLVGEAAVSVVCHILFDFAVVGICVAAVLATCALVLKKRKHHFVRPFLIVAKRISTVSAALAVPGICCLVFTGHLPESGVYNNFSSGFLVLWSMVTIYLCAEEMNFEWFIRNDESPMEIEPHEPSAAGASETTIANDRQSSDKKEPEQLGASEHHIDPARETVVNR